MKVQKKNKVKRIYKVKPKGQSEEGALSIPIKKVEIIEDENFEVDDITPAEQIVDLPSDVSIVKDFATNSIEKEDYENVETSERDDKTKTKWGKYEKRYKVEWESDPNLKEWMLPHPVDAGKVFCRYCHCSLRAHKSDLYKHRGARKHNRNACNFSDEEKKFITISKSSLKPQVITEKLKGPGGSIVLVKSERPLFNQDERENSHFIIEYGDNDHVETTIESESPENKADQEIREIATRIGSFLMDDLEALLKSQESIIKICKSAGDDAYSDGNLHKIAKICVAHLSQKYLVETVLESKSPTHFVTTKEKKKLSTKFKDIEEKLQRTVAEMKSLKLSLDGGSETQNFSTIDFADLLVTASNQNE